MSFERGRERKTKMKGKKAHSLKPSFFLSSKTFFSRRRRPRCRGPRRALRREAAGLRGRQDQRRDLLPEPRSFEQDREPADVDREGDVPCRGRGQEAVRVHAARLLDGRGPAPRLPDRPQAPPGLAAHQGPCPAGLLLERRLRDRGQRAHRPVGDDRGRVQGRAQRLHRQGLRAGGR